MLDIGLIGLGTEWERRYRPALLGLRHRMRVRAVYAPVASMAEQLAADWRCDVVYGMLALMERPDVRALMILDTAWYDGVPADFACRVGKPAFLAGKLCEWRPAAAVLSRLAASRDATLMPDFSHRYLPATSRLKELLASRLGRPREIVVEVGTAADSDVCAPASDGISKSEDRLARAFDWCCHLAGTPPAAVHYRNSGAASEVAISYRRPAAGGEPTTARLVLRPDLPADTFWNCEVRCEKGIAKPSGAAQIAWESADETRAESLAGERAEVEVMLDHFSRRVVGGLIPVPTLDDLRLAFQLADAAAHSRAAGKPVSIEAV